jgi:hypothetical protein
MQSKISMKYHYAPVNVVKIQNPHNAGMDKEEQELSFLAGGNAEWPSPFSRQAIRSM